MRRKRNDMKNSRRILVKRRKERIEIIMKKEAT
jgi:hypothetical protein